ncbi:hypothetical protein LOS78_18675 [Paracoccus sp. MA]|uniref:hypothetical protein n=1 Tax=Paracoccus sp. MA TaxID=2895796 RepID=UPI001E3D4C5B|nr:hypothetical protein [Paracoccus sp. MA]UFM65652.1 hypothetical protein LOS78_18675 [Paracoccus sp. MA]
MPILILAVLIAKLAAMAGCLAGIGPAGLIGLYVCSGLVTLAMLALGLRRPDPA